MRLDRFYIPGFTAAWILLIAALCVGLLTRAQSKAAAGDPAAVKLSAETALEIRNVQRHMDALEKQALQMEDQKKAMYAQYQADQKKLDELKAEALKAAGKPAEAWDVDVEKLAIVEKPKATPANPPIKAKPAETK